MCITLSCCIRHRGRIVTSPLLHKGQQLSTQVSVLRNNFRISSFMESSNTTQHCTNCCLSTEKKKKIFVFQGDRSVGHIYSRLTKHLQRFLFTKFYFSHHKIVATNVSQHCTKYYNSNDHKRTGEMRKIKGCCEMLLHGVLTASKEAHECCSMGLKMLPRSYWARKNTQVAGPKKRD